MSGTNFATVLQTLPTYALTDYGRGFLPLILRGYGHILYLAGRQAESPTRKPTDSETLDEFNCAIAHLSLVDVSNLSTASSLTIEQAVHLFERAADEFSQWSNAERETNYVSLANALIGVMAKLDREFLGLNNSDIGASL